MIDRFISLLKKIKSKYNNMSIAVKAAFWYTICNFTTKAISLLSTPIFTRIMTEEEYGSFAVFQSWFSILIIFTSLNIFLASYTKGLLKYKNKVSEFTSSQLSLTSFITTMFFIIYIFNISFFTKLFEISPFLMIFMFIELLFMPAFEFWTAKERFNYSYKKVVIYTIIMNLCSIVFSIISIILTKNYKLEARVISDVISKMIVAIPLFIILIIKGKKIFDKEYWKYSIKFNIPLIPHYLSNYVLNQSDRIMIGKMVGNIQAAFYSVAYTISMVMILLTSAINSSLTPYIYKCLDKKDTNSIRHNITPIAILVSLMSLSIMLFAPEIIRIFAGEKYLDSIYIIPPVSASVYFIFLYSMFSNVEYFYQKTSGISIATTMSAVINIVLNYIFIKQFGYYAAGYTTLICYILLSICHWIFYKKIIKNNFDKSDRIFDDSLMFSIGILLIVLMLILVYIYEFIFIRYIFLLILVLIIIFNRKKIMNITKLKG